MEMQNSPSATLTSGWEARQKHASFYQTQLGLVQQAAIAGQAAWATIVFTVGIAMAKLPDVPPRQISALIFVSAVMWILVAMWLQRQFQRRSERILTRYIVEYRTLFPGAAPYLLESYLLIDRIPSADGTSSPNAELKGSQATAPSVGATESPSEREEEAMG